MAGSRPSWASLGLDLVSLRVLIAAVEEGGITAAAQREGLATSAVSRRISELEARCGVKLLERGERGTTPTPAGRQIISQLFNIFDLLDKLARDLDAMKGGKVGLVRLHSHMSATASGLPAMLAQFFAANPGIEVQVEELTSLEVIHAVQTGMADVGLVSGTVPSDGLDIPFVGMQRDSALCQLYRQQAKAHGRKLEERVHATSFESVRNLVAAGLGVAILPRSAVEPFLGKLAIAMVRLDESWARRPLMLCVRNHAYLSAATRKLITHLQAQVEAERT